MIDSIYKDPRNPAGLSSVNKVYHAVKTVDPSVTRKDVRDELRSKYTYTLHFPARREWGRNKIVVAGPHIEAQVDLADMTAFEKENSGYKYILVYIDAFSRFALVKPLRSKKQEEVCDRLNELLDEYHVTKVQADQGKEFKNRHLEETLARRGVFLFFTVNRDVKCSIAERFNRTLKSKIFKYFTLRSTRKWLDICNDLIYSYNHSVHRTIKMAPADVTADNSSDVFKQIYDGLPDETALLSQVLTDQIDSVKFKVGDVVKLKAYVPQYDHRYYPNYNYPYYVIAGIARGYPHSRYKLRLWEDENDILRGSFYQEELQHVKVGEYRIQVLRNRKVRGETQHLIHYIGYPQKYDEWRSSEQLRELTV